MSRAILNVTTDIDFEKNEPYEDTLERARILADRPGLIWKVWLRDRTTNRSGGVLLFESRDLAQEYVDTAFKHTHPWTQNVVFEIIEIDEELSAITHAKLAPVQGVQS